MPRYLTKSRFKLGCECPTKLFYTGKRDQYADQSDENSFLMILAEGGFQVGELAKLYHPGGVDIPELDHDKALAQTAELLQQDKVVIFEAAIAYEKLFIRVDVLIKKGRQIKLIEVKAKSCRGTDPSQFLTKKGKPTSDWRAYLEDAAFQKYVTKQAHPEFAVHTHLMLVDKDRICPTDGLHQKFRIDSDQRGRSFVTDILCYRPQRTGPWDFAEPFTKSFTKTFTRPPQPSQPSKDLSDGRHTASEITDAKIEAFLA